MCFFIVTNQWLTFRDIGKCKHRKNIYEDRRKKVFTPLIRHWHEFCPPRFQNFHFLSWSGTQALELHSHWSTSLVPIINEQYWGRALHHVCLCPLGEHKDPSSGMLAMEAYITSEKAVFVSKETKFDGKVIFTALCVHLWKKIIFLVVLFMIPLKQEEEIWEGKQVFFNN